MYGDAAYCLRDSVAAGVVPGILHGINVTARGRGSGDAWGAVRDHLGGGPESTRLDPLGREGRGSQTHWKAKIGYSMRRVAEGASSTFKRIFGEHVMSLK